MSKAPSLTDSQRRDMRRWYKTGAFTQTELARIYGVHPNTVNRALAAARPKKMRLCRELRRDRKIRSSLTSRNTIICAEWLMTTQTYLDLSKKWHMTKRRIVQIVNAYMVEAMYAIHTVKAKIHTLPSDSLAKAIVSLRKDPTEKTSLEELEREIKESGLNKLSRYYLEVEYILGMLNAYTIMRKK